MERNSEKQHVEFLAEDPNVRVMPIMLSLIIGAFFAILNETLLNIALIRLMDYFHVPVTTVQWMVTGFMLVMGIVIPMSAPLLQWFTTRQMFIGTMFVFSIGTAICALAPVFSVLLIGRLLQAVGSGLLIPIIFNTFLLLFPPERRGSVMGLMGLVFMFAPAIGPTLSGIIVQHLGWRYLFISVIPFAVFSIVFAYKYLINVSEVTKPKVDVLSILLSTIGFGGVVFGFSSVGSEEADFASPIVYLPILIGAASLILFVVRQLRLDEPLMDLNVFRYPMFSHAVVLFLIVMMGMFSSEIILPMFMQGALMLSAAAAGLVLLPGSLLNGLMSPIMGRLFDKYGPRKLLIPGSVVLGATLFILTRLDLDMPIWLIAVCYILLMLSVSAMMMPAETNGLNELPKRLYPHGTAVMSTLQPVGGAIGVSVFISLMNMRQNQYLQAAPNPHDDLAMKQALVAGVEFVYYVAFASAVIAFILSLFVYRATPEDREEKKWAASE